MALLKVQHLADSSLSRLPGPSADQLQRLQMLLDWVSHAGWQKPSASESLCRYHLALWFSAERLRTLCCVAGWLHPDEAPAMAKGGLQHENLEAMFEGMQNLAATELPGQQQGVRLAGRPCSG